VTNRNSNVTNKNPNATKRKLDATIMIMHTTNMNPDTTRKTPNATNIETKLFGLKARWGTLETVQTVALKWVSAYHI
jgi:hypothetical protein